MGREVGRGKSEIHGGIRGSSAGVLCTLALWILQDFFLPTAQQLPMGRGLTFTLRQTTLGRIPPVKWSARPCPRGHPNPHS